MSSNISESIAFTIHQPKTAALAFDRVYKIPLLAKVPDDIGISIDPEKDNLFGAAFLGRLARNETGEYPSNPLKLMEIQMKLRENPREYPLFESFAKFVASLYHEKRDEYEAICLLENENERRMTVPDGPQQVLHRIITGATIVDEDELQWEQVTEFRKDAVTRRKYRKFIRWVDSALLKEGDSKAIEDIVHEKIEDYEWAIRKHGLKTKLGTISALLDPKFLGAVAGVSAAASVAGAPLWGALSGIVVAASRVAVEFSTKRIEAIDNARNQSAEIAYIVEMKKTLGK